MRSAPKRTVVTSASADAKSVGSGSRTLPELSTSNNGAFLPRLFLHYLDLYHYRLAKYIFRYPEHVIFGELRLATRLALLFSKEVFVPASAYFENPRTRRILRELSPLCEVGYLFLCAGDSTLAEHFEKKRTRRYNEKSSAELRNAYRKMPSIPVLYRSAAINTTKIMNEYWSEVLESGEVIPLVMGRAETPPNSNLERAWERIPEVLEERAFVSSHVIQSFEELGTTPPSEMALLNVLDPAFTLSYFDPLKAGLVDNLLYTQPPWTITAPNEGFSFADAKSRLITEGLLQVIDSLDGDGLLQLHLMAEWKIAAPYLMGKSVEKTSDIRRALKNIKRSLITIGVSKVTSPRQVVGVVTALPEEWFAVIHALNAKEAEPIENDPNRYALAQIQIPDSEEHVDVIVTFMPRVGTNSAATVTTNLLRSYPAITDLIFCGIGCGCPDEAKPEKHVRLGDIVVSDFNGIIQLDHQANKSGIRENRSSMPLPSRALLNAVRLLQSDEIENRYLWETYLDNIIRQNKSFKRPPASTDILVNAAGQIIRHPHDRSRRRARPRVFCGAIGSSNTLLRNRDLRNEFANEYDLRAIEMEGAGTAEAVWQFGKNYLVVRGVCDYGDDLAKNDIWHYYAAATAAAYMCAILNRMIAKKL
jgi:nucleoside phosphorylase